jgi:hypothetical protein
MISRFEAAWFAWAGWLGFVWQLAEEGGQSERVKKAATSFVVAPIFFPLTKN